MRFNLVFTLAASILLLGCAGSPKVIRDLYERQARLETKLDELSQDIESLKKESGERMAGIEQSVERIEKGVEQTYLDLNKRLDGLEQKRAPQASTPVRSPDALYSVAESYYRMGKFEEAILAFQRFIDAYPRDKRVPLSYLKQGVSLINIGKRKEPKFFFQTLIDKFPKSEEAKIAEEKLREIEETS